ncbi:MAG: type III-A CRISPR-associated RAMP protein Csm4 [Cyanobacteria bacterium NC_groundwater_1444_Ag_S-0.65um_54_12]|nr:type III-A CRISPR-associated RAMP protein Csm4 [Cyanobacteria bacterium NC_groundwater_1444_Ag_S-0.65um_54_12]
MPFCLYKLRFSGPVHFGADQVGIGVEMTKPICRADTFFSAYCHGLRALHGRERLEKWLKTYLEEPPWLISDLLPYRGDNLYWPRPHWQPKLANTTEEVDKNSSATRKSWKKWEYLPLDHWQKYVEALAKGSRPDLPSEEFASPWVDSTQTRVGISYSDQTELYQVGLTYFKDKAGLAVLVAWHDKPHEEFEEILEYLAESGIGGERSTGCGRFVIEDCYDPADSDSSADRLLTARSDPQPGEKLVMSLSTFSPDPAELTTELLDASSYHLVPRRGFAASPDAERARRRKSVWMLGSGSVLSKRVNGRMLDVAPEGFPHRVWRYGHPLWVRVW